MARNLIAPSKNAAVCLGVAFFLAGSYFLWEAFEGRGGATPRPLRPFTWW